MILVERKEAGKPALGLRECPGLETAALQRRAINVEFERLPHCESAASALLGSCILDRILQ